MEKLPIEIWVYIAKFLPVRDLSVCCTVSSTWRDMFGCDEIWKPRCDSTVEEHLRTTPCQVEPKFSISPTEDTSLSAVGRWRLAFMRETHLWCNWIHGNYKSENTGLKQVEVAFFLNDVLAVTRWAEFVGLRDMAVIPSVSVSTLKVHPKTSDFSPTFIRSNMIVFVDTGHVEVIGVDEEQQVLSSKGRFDFNYSKNIIGCIVINSVFLVLEKSNIKIWNLEDGKMRMTENCPMGITKFKTAFSSVNCEDVIVTSTTEDRKTRYFIYDTNSLRFLPFTLFKKQYTMCAIMKSYLALIIKETLTVYNYQTSQLLFVMPTNTPLVDILKGDFIFMNNGFLNHFSPKNGTLRCLVNAEILGFTKLGHNLVSVDFSILKRGGPQIWKIGPQSAVSTGVNLDRGIDIVSNKANSKVLIYRDMQITCNHFW